jgi:hypothetical protein
MQWQQYAPKSTKGERILLPLAFCRVCGQPYYVVYNDEQDGNSHFIKRDFYDIDRDKNPGYLYYSKDEPWPDDDDEEFELDNGKTVHYDESTIFVSDGELMDENDLEEDEELRVWVDRVNSTYYAALVELDSDSGSSSSSSGADVCQI